MDAFFHYEKDQITEDLAASYMGFKEVNERGLKMVADGMAPIDCETDGYLHN